MGVRGLLSYCSPIQTRILIGSTHTRPSSIGIDAYSVFYHFKQNTQGAQHFLEELLRSGHTITFVIDRRASAQKQETVKRREAERTAAAVVVDSLSKIAESDDYKDLSPAQKRAVEQVLAWKKQESWHMTPAILHEYRVLCERMGISVELAEEEADIALARGVKEGRWDTVVSGDSDLLLLRVPRLWLLSRSPAHVKEISLDDFNRFTGLSAEQACSLAVLAGSDVSTPVLLPIANAISWLRYYGSIDVIHARFPDVVRCEDMIRWKMVQGLYSVSLES